MPDACSPAGTSAFTSAKAFSGIPTDAIEGANDGASGAGVTETDSMTTSLLFLGFRGARLTAINPGGLATGTEKQVPDGISQSLANEENRPIGRQP
jgi:hypothetical protein